MSAISRVTRAATETQRTDRGENRIPAVWRARVVYIRESTADCGHRPGVYVTVPNFTRGEIHGPVQVVGDTPAEGDLVVAVAVEGRKNDWIIITGNDATEILARLDTVEALVAATQSQLDILDTYVEHEITARMGRLEWDVDEVLAPRIGAVETGLAALPGIEVDTSAGTLVTLGGVPIHYDSGWRDITQSHPGDYPLTVGSYFYVRRTLDTIQLTYRYNFAEPGEGIARISGSLPGFAWRPMDTGSADGNRGTQKITHRWWNHSAVDFYNWYRPDIGTGGIDHHTSLAITGTSILPANPVIPTSLIGDPT